MEGKYSEFVSKYKVIGFDMDHTFVRYRLDPFIKHIYDCMVNYLVNDKGYPRDGFNLDYWNHEIHYIINGLVVDIETGHVLKADEDRVITHGYHGKSPIDQSKLEALYGLPAKIPDLIANPDLRDRFKIEMTFFGCCNALIYSQIIDVKERNNEDQDFRALYKDMRYALESSYTIKNDEDHEKSLYFRDIVNNPQEYLHDTSEIGKWIEKLKTQNYRFFLVTNSQITTTQRLMTYTYGEKWMDLFDFTIVNSRKPGFFKDATNVLRQVSDENHDGIPSDKIETGGIYREGSFDHVLKYYAECHNLQKNDILFAGDHYLTDTYAASAFGGVDTVTIVEEMMTHLGLEIDVPNASDIWGSHFYSDKEKTKKTFWFKFLQENSTYIIPILEY
eukprot:CAMPEP_0115032100 /NCGR_PEP_ID=MMETSP0216-20121206/38953_1 /TAXON_ID=223996 /ORGANISM="Protocruzia adherens, Strain Boccale" /LENGTH=388 /DNA_ID=CAMNT_0002409927 /DNA_START=191 /DNA_END=1354 /DNA_ORIENTATION=+